MNHRPPKVGCEYCQGDGQVEVAPIDGDGISYFVECPDCGEQSVHVGDKDE